MNAEPPPPSDPPPHPTRIPKFVWVLVALSPSAIFILVSGNFAHHPAPRWLMDSLGFTNLALSLVGGVGILWKQERDKWTLVDKVNLVLGSIFLAAVFFVLNVGIGLFCACAMSTGRIAP